MMKTLIIMAMCAACHSATIRVERVSSGAIERDHDFHPKRGVDNHFISFPAYPFVNCMDAVEAELIGSRRGDRLLVDRRHGITEADVLGANACASAQQYSGFLGYKNDELLPGAAVSWIPEDGASQDGALKELSWRMRADAHPAEWPTHLGSFIHLSDVQIREHDATLGNASVSARLDKLVQSFQRDPEQELYSMFVYASFVDTINAEHDLVSDPARPAPTMMIHTGDAVDAGLQSEFEQFQRLSDKLVMPWFQVIGNHDTLAFGNLRMMPKGDHRRTRDEDCEGTMWSSIACTCTRTADLIREFNLRRPDNLGHVKRETPSKLFTLVPALLKRICLVHDVRGDEFVMNPKDYDNTINAFIAAHCRLAADGKTCAPPPKPELYPVASDAHTRCATQDGKGPRSVLNGFDLRDDGDILDRRVAESRAALTRGKRSTSGLNTAESTSYGYYCFEFAKAEPDKNKPRIWMIALNTSTTKGAYGEVIDSQRTWLREVLDGGQIAKDDLVLVFGHHPVYDIFDADARDDLIDILTSHSNVVGYFAGHTHGSELRLIHPRDESKLTHHVWEIIAPAIISYPQQGRQVNIKRTGELGYLEILSFTPTGTGESEEKVERAYAGSRRDKCQESPKSCENDKPRLPGREVTYPRLFFRMPSP